MFYHGNGMKEAPETPSAVDWMKTARACLVPASRVVVCGIGNEMRGDDAAGVLCLRFLENRAKAAGPERRSVFFIDGGETPENRTSGIRSFSPDLVILVDAARGGGSPGDIFIVDQDAIADEEVSTHRISLALLVRYIEESIGARVLFIGIEPLSTEAGSPVSPAVQAAVRAAVDGLSRLIFNNSFENR